jgi:hypothetical protein
MDWRGAQDTLDKVEQRVDEVGSGVQRGREEAEDLLRLQAEAGLPRWRRAPRLRALGGRERGPCHRV